MPNTLRDHLEAILSRHLAAAVDEAVDAYRTVIEAGIGGGARRGRPAGTATTTTRAAGRRRPGVGAKVSAALKGRPCPVPGCTNPSKGPRFRFFCEEHRNLPKAEQERIIAAAKGGDGKSAAPKTGRRGRKPRKDAAAKAAE